MAYDAVRRRLVVFGGFGAPANFLKDTWEYDGTSWRETTPASGPGPSARMQAGATFDASVGRVVLVGGYDPSGYLSDLWEWDGAAWRNATPASAARPSARSSMGLAFDSARGKVMVFGGADGSWRQDLWERDADPARQPGLQFTASSAAGSIDPAKVTGLRVRAHCGGVYAPFGAADLGATLDGWASGGPSLLAGQWLQLAGNSTGLNAAQPYLPAPNAALIDWAAGSPAEASRFLLARDGQLSFQCRPAGTSGSSGREAQVALDYVEVRVRYLTR
jgi:hypothetical protein